MTHLSRALARIDNALALVRAASSDDLPDWRLELLRDAHKALISAKSELALELAGRVK